MRCRRSMLNAESRRWTVSVTIVHEEQVLGAFTKSIAPPAKPAKKKEPVNADEGSDQTDDDTDDENGEDEDEEDGTPSPAARTFPIARRDALMPPIQRSGCTPGAALW